MESPLYIYRGKDIKKSLWNRVVSFSQMGQTAIIFHVEDSDFSKEIAARMTLLGCTSVLVTKNGIASHDSALRCLKHLMLGELEKGLGKVVLDLSLQVGTSALSLYGLNTRCVFF